MAVRLSDEIAKMGAKTISLDPKKHLLNHASSEDIMLMLNLMKPKYYMPVMAEYRHMVANADVAYDMGIPKENIILKLNGEVVTFENGKLTEDIEKIKINDILIDGNSSQDIGELVLKDRELLSENGIVIVCATLSKKTKAILAGPEIISRGFIYVKESTEFIEQIKDISLKIINSNITSSYVDFNKIKEDIRNVLGKFLYEETECKPMIITIINEIEK